VELRSGSGIGFLLIEVNKDRLPITEAELVSRFGNDFENADTSSSHSPSVCHSIQYRRKNTTLVFSFGQEGSNILLGLQIIR
jgi:hypothetical protein